jgi:predicted MFS family arabinose efflux permease
VQVLPVVLLALPAGHVADRYDRKRVVIASLALLGLCSVGLALLSSTEGSLVLIYACLVLVGVARAFHGPASSALLPQVVPAEHLTNAATWSSSAWQGASIAGPALGGLVIAIQGTALPVYLGNAAIVLVLILVIGRLRPRQVVHAGAVMTVQSLLSGLRFVWNTRVILAALTLDLFAVLLGGATALLPIYASDILHVGTSGLGWLRAAPAVGAMLAGVVIAHRTPLRRTGWTLLIVVAGFGAATIGFGISRSLGVSLAMLFLLGAFDSVSVVIRTTLELTRTPAEMRGRVNAIHGVFIGLSSELGAFESGVAAQVLGPVGAVTLGGIGTILVVVLVAIGWPEVRRLQRLDPTIPRAAC